MNATAYFIADRALTLAYEAAQFPEASPMALAWLRLARAWAKRQGLEGLLAEIHKGTAMCPEREQKQGDDNE